MPLFQQRTYGIELKNILHNQEDAKSNRKNNVQGSLD